MNKRVLIFPLAALATVALSGCSKTNPNDIFMKDALNYYKALRQDQNVPDGEDYYAWYFDSELLKGAVFNNVDDYEYLGIINLQHFNFSEFPNEYFLDIPNYTITFDLENGSVALPDEFQDPMKFIKELPLVLVKENEEKNNDSNFTIYSRFLNDGILSNSATSNNYDPTFFYIKDFKYDINVDGLPESVAQDFSIDYTNKYTAILKRDIYTALDEMLKSQNLLENIPIEIDLTGTLLKNYRRVNSLSENENLPSTLVFPGEFNSLPVVVGPMGLFDYVLDGIYKEGEPVKSSIHEIKNVVLEEGISELSLFAFDKNQNITSIELPSTIEKLCLSSLSNLTNLEYLYIPDTVKPIDIINTYGASLSLQNPMSDDPNDKITICGPLQGSSIKNSLTFENYDNINAKNFPYFDVVLSEGKTLADTVNYVINTKENYISSLSEGFTTLNLDAINPLFMMDLDAKNPLIEKDNKFTTIEKNKTLYLAHNKAKQNNDLFGTNIENFHEVSGSDHEGINSLTLKLATDLTIKGNLIVGGIIGKHNNISGINVGQFAQIDLNGFKIVVDDGGLLDVNGKIIDSSDNKTGSIEVKNNGVLKTNLVVHDNFGYVNYLNKYENNDFPYNYYDFSNIDVSSVKLLNGSKLIAYETVVESGASIFQNEFVFFGNDGVYQNINKGSLNIVKDINKTILNFEGDISYNEFPLVFNSSKNPATSKLMFSPISSSKLGVIVNNGSLTINSKTKIINGGSLKINNNSSLILNNDLFVYPELDKDLTGTNYLGLPKVSGQLILNGNLSLSNNVSLAGYIQTTLLNTNLLQALNDTRITPLLSNNEGCYQNGSYEVLHHFTTNLHVINDENNEQYYRFNNGYYYSYVNGKTLISKISDNSVIASKEGENSWVANVNENKINTSIFNDTINSFKDHINTYTLDETGKWNVVSNEDHNHIFKDENNRSYILIDNQLISGTLLDESKLIFKTNDSNKLYHYENVTSSWKYVHLFEYNHVFAYPKANSLSPNIAYDKNNYEAIYLLDEENQVKKIKEYDAINHIITLEDNLTFITVQISKLDLSSKLANINKEINSRKIATNVDNVTKYIYLNKDKVWVEAKAIENDVYATTLRDDDNFVYTSNNVWERTIKYNNEFTLGFTLYQLLDANDITRNFALYEETSNIASVIVKRGELEISRKQLVNIGLDNLIPTEKEMYIGYRYFIKNGEYCIFVENEEGFTTIQTLNKEPSLETYNENIDGDLTLMKLTSLIQINTDSKYYYINFEKVVASGTEQSLMNETYIALAVYKDKAPDFGSLIN